MDEQGVIEKLRKIELFDAVKDDEERLTKLARIVTWQQCKAGVEVISEGVEGSELYILYKGMVKIHKRTLEQEPYTIVTLRGRCLLVASATSSVVSQKRSFLGYPSSAGYRVPCDDEDPKPPLELPPAPAHPRLRLARLQAGH